MSYSNRSVSCAITREQLHRLVWSEPMTSLAGKLDLSGRGLAKMCERHRVPRPGRGYWQKKQHGHSVEPTPLPELEEDEEKLATVRFSRHTRPAVEEDDGEGEFASVIADQKAYEDKPENQITVPDEVDEWHELMQSTLKAREIRKQDEWWKRQSRDELPDEVNIDVSLDQRDRAHRIMNTILLALEERGFEPRIEDGETLVDVHDIDLPILLREKQEQVEKERFRSTYLDLEPTGRLELKIDEKYGVRGVRKTWRDGKTQRVEGLLNDFMVGLVRAVVVKAKEDQERKESHRKWERKRQRERQRKRRAELRKKRRQDLHDQAERWEQAEKIRRYVMAVRERVETTEQVQSEDELREWLDWAEEYVEAYDPLNALGSVPYQVEEEKGSGRRGGSRY